MLDQRRKLKDMCSVHNHMTSNIKGTLRTPLDEEKLKEITNQILVAEARVLKVVNFDFNFPIPYPYLRCYTDLLYPKMTALHNLALAIVNDFISTKAPLIYHARTLAISAMLMAANLLKMTLISDSKFSSHKNWLQLKKTCLKLPHDNINLYEDTNEDKYMSLPWYKRIHPKLTIDEIEGKERL